MLGSCCSRGGRLHNISPPFRLTKGLRRRGNGEAHIGRSENPSQSRIHETEGAPSILQGGSSSPGSNGTALGPKAPKNSTTKNLDKHIEMHEQKEQIVEITRINISNTRMTVQLPGANFPVALVSQHIKRRQWSTTTVGDCQHNFGGILSSMAKMTTMTTFSGSGPATGTGANTGSVSERLSTKPETSSPTIGLQSTGPEATTSAWSSTKNSSGRLK